MCRSEEAFLAGERFWAQMMTRYRHFLLLAIYAVANCLCAQAQEHPGLFFREDWKEIPPAKPVTQEHVSNLDLLVSRYGPGEAGIKKSHHDQPADDPWYIWSGEALGNWAITLRHKKAWLDLTGLAKVRWRSKQDGYRELRLIAKLADGRWLVGDQVDGPSSDWRVHEFNVADLHWRRLDIQRIVEGTWEPNPDLSRVDEVGWTDLMTGGGSAACSRVDWIEVYGKAVPR
jgi:hypothetical protein